MRLRSLMALSAITALLVPVSSEAAGGTYQVTETVTLEADIDAPVPTKLVAVMRTRRVATVNVDPAGPWQPLSGNTDERSVTVSLVYTGPGEDSGSMLCFVDSSKASMTENDRDSVTIKVTAASCPMEISFSPSSDPLPFLRGFAAGGVGAHNGFELGYNRNTTSSAGKLFGEDATVFTSKMSRVQAFSARPSTTAGAPNPPSPPNIPDGPPALPEAPALPQAPALPEPAPPSIPEP